MASERLQVILDLEAGAYRRGAKQAADSTKEIGAAASETGGQTASMRDEMKSAQVTMLKFAAVGIPIALGITRAVEALHALNIEAEAVENRFEQIFGPGSDDMRQWTDEVNERFGMSERSVRDLANGVADLLVPLGFTRTEAAGLTQESLHLANALSEWSGGQIEVADATERVRKALLGERESLEELGVKVLQSDVNARLLAAGQGDLEGAERKRAEALATLNIIQEKSTDALAAYTSGANKALIKQKELQAAQEDSAQSIAEALAPELELITDLASDATNAGADLIEMLRDLRGASEDTAEAEKSLIESGLELIATHGPEGLGKTISDLIDKWIDYQRASEAVTTATADAATAANNFELRLAGTAGAAEQAAGGIGSIAQAIRDLQAAERAATDPVFALREAEEKLNEAFTERVRLQAEGAPTREVLDALDDELRARQDLTFAQETFNDQADTTFGDLDTYAQKVGIQSDLWQAWKDEVLGLVQGLEDLDRLSGSGFGGRIPAPGTAGSGFVDSHSADGRISGRAVGGPMDAFEPYLVGERGVELVIPNTSSYVVPNHQLGGSSTVENNYRIEAHFDGVMDRGRAQEFVRWMNEELERYRGGKV